MKTISVFSVLVSALSATTTFAALEKYSATVEDGTAKTIQARTKVDGPKPSPEEFLEATPSPVSSDSTIADLRREQTEMRKRLELLEKTRTEYRASQAAVSDEKISSPATPVPATPGSAPLNLTLNLNPAPSAPLTAAPAAPSAVTAQASVEPAPKTSPPAGTNPAPTKEKFDVVPDGQVKVVAERLKYANEILKRFGRAYDYRTTTLAEFKKILSELDRADEALQQKTQSEN